MDSFCWLHGFRYSELQLTALRRAAQARDDRFQRSGHDIRIDAHAEQCDRIADAQCLILDISMPGMSGPELQCELIRQGHRIPTIFMTARSKDSVPADLLQQGAVECLFKPFSGAVLRAALIAALN